MFYIPKSFIGVVMVIVGLGLVIGFIPAALIGVGIYFTTLHDEIDEV